LQGPALMGAQLAGVLDLNPPVVVLNDTDIY
jgi:hypothetical protein